MYPRQWGIETELAKAHGNVKDRRLTNEKILRPRSGIAYNDPQWDRNGRPVSMDFYKYVSAILLNEEVTSQFEETFGGSGYRIEAVTIEKVLVGGFRDVPLYQGKMIP